ncbi:MAG: ferredoxin--NADP reductase [Pseudomonadota bacterium]
MASVQPETVLDVHHWNSKLFSFKTTRDQSLRFRNGEFVMIGLPGEKRPILRAYSIASPNYEEHLEFLSIKVPDGELTSKLQLIQPGEQVLISRKPTGTLVIDDLRPGKNLYLFATGTGLAPFQSIIQDPETYEKFENVILCHSVRHASELAYKDFIEQELPKHPYFGTEVSNQLIYYPTVTREAFKNQGRLTDLIRSGKIFDDIGLDPIEPSDDRAMICGNPGILRDMTELLKELGLEISPRSGVHGDFVIERAFVD